ncbi:hypothetical protein UFOVP117_369 [uncultured Caudovirales phage]|uniref:Uncharacterized protein n=1 Tax=uncultured Caudovirales phage TaxID=2100421 RepID=A0A6J5L6R6_9CAUD|nr:hypothetical protein UFOVP117_369 [uncultured Caudovirales phage]
MELIQGEKFKTLHNGKNIFYCNTHDVNNFFDNINFDNDFILISHNSDGNITDNPLRDFDADVKKIPKNLKRWFGQNLNYESDIIESIPIGFENSEWFPEIRKIQKLLDISLTPKNIKNLVYLNLNILNNPSVRQPIYDMLKDKHYVTTEYGRNGLTYDNYLNNLYNHRFMVCPEGNGIDVHQPWESLHVNTIPIQKKNINNKNWRELPICWVDEWEQITDENFLNSEYDRITKNTINKTKLDFNFWRNKILNSI